MVILLRCTFLLLLLLLLQVVHSTPDVGGGSCLSLHPWSDSGPFFINQDIPSELCLNGPLLPSHKYELKLSFREPEAKFALSLIQRTFGPPSSRSPPGSRIASSVEENQKSISSLMSAVLLDSEKLEFWTNNEGRVVLCRSDGVMLTSSCESLPVERIALKVLASSRYDAIGQGQQGLWFNVRFDPVYFGFLPARALSLFIVIPFALTFTISSVLYLLNPSSPFFSQDKEATE